MLPRPVNNKDKVGDEISVEQSDGKWREAKIFKPADDTPQHTSARPIIITSSVTQFHIFEYPIINDFLVLESILKMKYFNLEIFK